MAAARSFYGFRFAGTLYGGPNAKPIIKKFLAKDDGQITKGDVLNQESGEVDLAATDDAALIGVANETVVAVDSTTWVEVITNHDAVWAVYDAVARTQGATLDIAGSTGQYTLATSSNVDVVVARTSGADEPTYVMFARAETLLNF